MILYRNSAWCISRSIPQVNRQEWQTVSAASFYRPHVTGPILCRYSNCYWTKIIIVPHVPKLKENLTVNDFRAARAVKLSVNVLIYFLDVVTGSCPPQLALQTNRLHSSPNLPYLKCSCLYAILLWVWPSNTNMWELVAVNRCPQLFLVVALKHFFQMYDSWYM